MRTLIKAAIRTFIILSGLQVLLFLSSNLTQIFTDLQTYLESNYLWESITTIALTVIITALVLFILWRKTDWLVKLVAGQSDDNVLTINTTNVELITVMLRVLGIILVLTTLPDLAGLIGYHRYSTNFYNNYGVSLDQALDQANELKQWITAIVTIIVGIWLTLGGRGIVTALDKIWSAQEAGKDNDTEK